ncbi:hypothetical protein SLEP1_g9672 [Rubroshorea leprosula]|uniref:Uncharacterized protein n=1 Tax=Rubroshorea leprosula TaxID=152421 RepID=A0AAV5IBC8_9ROSI|nr:hypothetical protein SLEP1_g9672 [Rubroshorea leprosula]
MITSGMVAWPFYSYAEEFTDGFCEENYLVKFQFGQVYYGTAWEDEDEDERVEVDEIQLLEHFGENSHPNLAKLSGYFQEDSFSWLERIKAALGFASVLDFMHSHNPPHFIRNIDAAHIMIDVVCLPPSLVVDLSAYFSFCSEFD